MLVIQTTSLLTRTGRSSGFIESELSHPLDSNDKEAACNVGDLGSIPGLGRSPGGKSPWEPTLVFLSGESP